MNSEQCTFGSVQCVYSEQCTFGSGSLAVEPREKPCFLKSNLFPHLPLLALGLARSIFTKYSLDFSHFTRSHICLNSILRIQHARKLCKRFSVITELNRLYMLYDIYLNHSHQLAGKEKKNKFSGGIYHSADQFISQSS